MTQSLTKLREAIVADGVVDADEVRKLRERIYADGRIDRDEAELLFDINDAVSGKANDAGWQGLFVDAICDYLLKDEKSPGAVDDQEATWLLERIQRDEKLDDTERALLQAIENRATSIDDKLKKFIASA
jgi:tellurite resistance protein